MGFDAAVSTFEPIQSFVWRGWSTAYVRQGISGQAPDQTAAPAIVLIHGFGASLYHWRKNIPALADVGNVFAIDLLGFGASAKPTPGEEVDYLFETWGQQVVDFCREVVGGPAILVGNSIGCIVAMQAAVMAPQLVTGVAMLNCSLRLLHERKQAEQPFYKRLGAPILQAVLENRAIGHWFFQRLANPKAVRNILKQAYKRHEAVTDELVNYLLAPAADRGAADVFLAFTRYSFGPLPEDLLPKLQCPALVLWGEMDPWEPVEMGRSLFSQFPAVEQFEVLAGLGHCPQDEAPEVVNPLLQDWVRDRF
ncbi:MAG: alpha/beta fold hydrolase [Alkalinema sp. RU_4_3]|nr:alpha/beta fold hydrolase [Alkalinema sp. RU_4_3]